MFAYPHIIYFSRMKATSINAVSTLFLKAVLVLIGIAVLALCVFFFPLIGREILAVPELNTVSYPGLLGFYLTPIPFLFALYQAFLLLQLIDKNIAFSQTAISALVKIKYCAIAMSILYAMGLPLAMIIAELDDAPGLGAIALAFVCAPLVVATFAAVLQKLLHSALLIKMENDLTV
jgi:hypothetical protein